MLFRGCGSAADNKVKVCLRAGRSISGHLREPARPAGKQRCHSRYVDTPRAAVPRSGGRTFQSRSSYSPRRASQGNQVRPDSSHIPSKKCSDSAWSMTRQPCSHGSRRDGEQVLPGIVSVSRVGRNKRAALCGGPTKNWFWVKVLAWLIVSTALARGRAHSGDVAQLAAQDLCKVKVESSSLFVSTVGPQRAAVQGKARAVERVLRFPTPVVLRDVKAVSTQSRGCGATGSALRSQRRG